MPNIRAMIESKYLKREDLGPREAAYGTVVKVGRINVGKEERPDMQWAVRFEEFPKPLLLKPTNIKLMALACGSEETDDWIGKRVVLWWDPSVQFAGELKGGLRIRAAKSAAAAPAVSRKDPGLDVDFAPDGTMVETSGTRAPAPRTSAFDDMDEDIPF